MRPEQKKTLAEVLVWLAVWQLAAVLIGHSLILVGPVQVLGCLWRLVGEGAFWQSVGQTAVRILQGYLLGVAAGGLLAGASARQNWVRWLADPVMSVIRAVPVASFIILVLFCVSSARLCAVVVFLMVLPVVYTGFLQGLDARDKALAEMAAVFRVNGLRRLRYLTLPQLLPWMAQSCRTAVGLAWKSGVAAEVIGLPDGSIGERLYQTKLFLETGELFAWTLVIVLLSALCERAIAGALAALERRLAA